MHKHDLVDLVKSFPMLRSLVQIFIFQFLSMSLFLNLLFETDSYSNGYLLAKIGVDTAENEPLEVHLIFQPWDLIFTEPPRPGLPLSLPRTMPAAVLAYVLPPLREGLDLSWI